MVNKLPGKKVQKATIGILAVQGDFEKHQQMILQLGHEAVLAKTKKELFACDGLVIPGGESTTLSKLFRKHDLWHPLKEFARTRAIFGTCAGLIVLATDVENNSIETLGLIDIKVTRNAYGRQVDSFIDDIQIDLKGEKITFEGVFIRAPRIVSIGDGVKPIAWHKTDIVMVEKGKILIATFHPELTNDTRIHRYFIGKVIG